MATERRFRLIRWFVMAAISLGINAEAKEVLGNERLQICLNGSWLFHGGGEEREIPTKNWTPILVPGLFGHWHPTDLHYYGSFAWYKTGFAAPKEWSNVRRVFVRFVSVNAYAHVYVNGQSLGTNTGFGAPFEFDATAAVRFGQINELAVFVDDWGHFSKRRNPPGRFQSPFIGCGLARSDSRNVGIEGDVYLVCRPSVHIADVFVMTSVRKKSMTVRTWLSNTGNQAATVTLSHQVFDGETRVKAFPSQEAQISPGKTLQVESAVAWEDPRLWGYGKYGSPHLYRLCSSLGSKENEMDTLWNRFGFREMWAEGTKLIFNGQPIFLAGDSDSTAMADPFTYNRHYINQALIARRMANVNFVRLGWEARLPTWFEVADEAGMLLEVSVCGALPEGPMAGEIERQIRGYVRAYRNHPSLVLWESNNESGSQSLGVSPRALKGLYRIHQICKEEDSTRLVHPQGSPWVGRTREYDIPYDPDIWDVHPYGSPLMNDVQSIMQLTGYDGKRPFILGEVAPLNQKMGWGQPGFTAEQRKAAWEIYHDPIANFWKESAPACHEGGGSGFMVLELPLRGWVGPTSPDSYDGGPWEVYNKNEPGQKLAIAWPSHSGPDMKMQLFSTQVGYHNVNWWDPSRKTFGFNVVSEALKIGYRQILGGDLPPLRKERRPEVIVTVTTHGRPIPDRYVILTRLGPDPGESVGVRADEKGQAWFVLPEAGKYQLALAHEDGVITGPTAQVAVAVRQNQAGYDFIQRVEFKLDDLGALKTVNNADLSREEWLKSETERAAKQMKIDQAEEKERASAEKTTGLHVNSSKATYRLCPVSEPITIDGKGDEWVKYPAIQLGFPEQMARRGYDPATRLRWLGRADCSGQIRLAWEPKAIYVFAQIRDDNARESAQGAEPWREDGIEVYLGLKGPAYETREYDNMQGRERTDFQFILAAGSKIKPRAVLGNPPNHLREDAGKVKMAVDGNPAGPGYTIEARIDLSDLGNFELHAGDEIGLNVMITDVDQRDGKIVRRKMDWACDAGDDSYQYAGLWNKAVLLTTPPKDEASAFRLDYPVTLAPGLNPQVTVGLQPSGEMAFFANDKPIFDRAYIGFATGRWKSVITGHGLQNWSPRMSLSEGSEKMEVALTAGSPQVLDYQQTLVVATNAADLRVQWELLCAPGEVPGVNPDVPDSIAGDFCFFWNKRNVLGRSAVMMDTDESMLLGDPSRVRKLGDEANLAISYGAGNVRLHYSTDSWPIAFLRPNDFCVSTGRDAIKMGEQCRFEFQFMVDGKVTIPCVADRLKFKLETQLTSAGGRDPTWSPDGTWIAYTADHKGKSAIWKIQAVTPQKPILLCPDGEQPAWSPDGLRIAFVRKVEKCPTIMVINADGTDVQPVTHDHASDVHPCWWKPDQLICETASDQRHGLSLLNLEDGSRQWLPYDGVKHPSVLPSQELIAYVKGDDGANQSCIWVEHLPGKCRDEDPSRKQITNDGGNLGGAFWPDLSVEGRLAYGAMSMQPASDIFLCDFLRGVAPQPLTDDHSSNETPRWSPDGKVIAYSKLTSQGRREIFLIKVVED